MDIISNNSKRKIRTSPTIQIAPFVDVMLVLLIIFMIATPIVLSGIDVSLPQGGETLSINDDDDFLTVSLSADGKVYVDKEVYNYKNFMINVKQKKPNTKSVVFIKADKSIKYGLVIDAMNQLNKNGYTKTILVTDYKENEK